MRSDSMALIWRETAWLWQVSSQPMVRAGLRVGCLTPTTAALQQPQAHSQAPSAYTVDTASGRCVATLDGISPAPPDYAFYIVSADKLLALSLDSASTSGLVTGEIAAQTGGPYSDGSLSSTVVMGVDRATASGSRVTLGDVTFDGNGNATFSLDENSAGTVTTVIGNGTYTAPDPATGRFTLTPPQGMPSLAGYLVS